MKEKVVFKEKKKPLSASDKVFNVFNYLLFGLLTLICLYPFYYLIINTISANDLSANGLITLIPKGIHFENYKQVLQLSGLSTAALISVARTVLGTGLTVLASAFLGFMFTQEKMWGRSFWYRVIVITMYFNAGLIPMFITMKTLHLNNTFWIYILPAIVQPYNIILVKTYVESIPKALQEAAEIDGANSIQKFFKLTVPLLKPTTFFLTITGIISSFKVFGYTNVMTGGGPGSSTYTLVYYIYTSAFKYYKMGYASAIAVILFVMLLIVTIIQWVHNNKEEKG